MRALALVALLALSTPALAGELYDGYPVWSKNPHASSGSIDFSSIITFGQAVDGATIAYVDFRGTAESLTLYKQTPVPNDAPSLFNTNAWVYPVATATSFRFSPDGWARFDFRALKLLVTSVGFPKPNFDGGRGPFLGVENGSFEAFDEYRQDPFVTGNAYYADVTNQTLPSGPIPIFRIIWETLDAPYVATNGDADRDGDVDLSDFGALRASYGQRVGYRLVADFDGSGVVSSADFNILKANFGTRTAATAPEPSGWLLLAIGVASIASFGSSRFRRPPVPE